MFRLATLIVFLLTAVLGDHVDEEMLTVLKSAASQLRNISEQSNAPLTSQLEGEILQLEEKLEEQKMLTRQKEDERKLALAERDTALQNEEVILFWKWFWRFETFLKWLRKTFQTGMKKLDFLLILNK